MVLAVNFGYRKDRVKTFIFLLLTAALGATLPLLTKVVLGLGLLAGAAKFVGWW